MIDTDKYEGHTEGPWKTGGYNVQAIMVWTVDGLDETQNWIQVPMADRLLAVDAPLLLEEVKRLQIYERIVLCIALHQQLPDGLHVDEELMLRAREHLRKNGEWEGEEE